MGRWLQLWVPKYRQNMSEYCVTVTTKSTAFLVELELPWPPSFKYSLNILKFNYCLEGSIRKIHYFTCQTISDHNLQIYQNTQKYIMLLITNLVIRSWTQIAAWSGLHSTFSNLFAVTINYSSKFHTKSPKFSNPLTPKLFL